MLYLPLWLASTYLKQSVFRFRFLRLSVENILLILGLFEFVLSRPRVGLAAFLLMMAFLLLIINIKVGKRLNALFINRFQINTSRKKIRTFLISVLTSLSLITVYFGLALLILYLGSLFDERMGLLFKPIPSAELAIIKAMDENTLLYFGMRLQFLERVIYWLSGWHIFSDYPILGVGLGNAGFFVTSHVPPSGWMTTELRDLFYRLEYMVNTKSYWFRILAETGLVGFSFFLTWLTGLWRSARFLWNRSEKMHLVVGLAGQLALIAFIFEGFSLDSFALPYLWVTAGLISATRLSATE
jgi:hypothetical protein